MGVLSEPVESVKDGRTTASANTEERRHELTVPVDVPSLLQQVKFSRGERSPIRFGPRDVVLTKVVLDNDRVELGDVHLTGLPVNGAIHQRGGHGSEDGERCLLMCWGESDWDNHVLIVEHGQVVGVDVGAHGFQRNELPDPGQIGLVTKLSDYLMDSVLT